MFQLSPIDHTNLCLLNIGRICLKRKCERDVEALTTNNLCRKWNPLNIYKKHLVPHCACAFYVDMQWVERTCMISLVLWSSHFCFEQLFWLLPSSCCWWKGVRCRCRVCHSTHCHLFGFCSVLLPRELHDFPGGFLQCFVLEEPVRHVS